jgi:Mce-associated membrane protein
MSAPRHPHHPRRPAAAHPPRVVGHPASPRSRTAVHRPRVSTDSSQEAPVSTDASVSTEAPAGTNARRRVPLPALLAVLTVLLGAFAIVAATKASALRDSTGQNAAFTDSVTTSQITSQVSTEVDTIFSYNYTDIARTRQAARRVLTGPAIRQYASTIRTVALAAARDKLVVTTAVTYAGVEYLSGDRAHVLAFVNLSDTSAVTGQTTSQPGMLAVDVVRQGNTWKITNIHTFTSAS